MKFKIHYLTPLCGMILFLSLPASQAQTTATWIGPASGGEWNTAANWSTLLPPGSDVNQTTNVVIGNTTNVNYNLPMTATTFGSLTCRGVLNVNTNGFNNTGIFVSLPGGGAKLLVNTGAVVNVNGNLGFSSNAIVSLAAGSSVSVSGSLLVGCGTGGGTSSTTVGSFGAMTNNGGTLFAANTSLNPGNASITTSALLVINGGTNNLGNVSIKRSNAGSGGYSTLGSEGLIINNGIVTMTNANVGGGSGNSFLTMLIAGGVVTNIGNVAINQGSSARGSRLLQTGGLFVVSDPNLVNPNPTVSGSLNVYSVTGGTNIVGGFSFGNASAGAGTVNFTNAAVIYVGGQGIVSNGAVLLSAALNGGGLFGATAPWTGSAAMKLTGGTFTFQAADMNNNPNNITLLGSLNGTGALNKTGGGALTLGAANTYSGNTFIKSGTLALGAGGSLTSPQIFLGSGTIFDVSQASSYALGGLQTLSGFGTVTGAVTAAASAIIYPGSNTLTGTLTFTNGLTENGGVINEFNLSSNPSGPNNDFINASGGLILTGTNTILINGALANGGVYPLIYYGGSLTGDVTNFIVSGAVGLLSNSLSAQTIYFVNLTSYRAATNVVWLGNASANIWDTESSTNWLDNGVGQPDYFVPGDKALFGDLGVGNPTVNIPGSVNPGSITINTSSNYTFAGNGAISGIGSLTVSNGTLTVLTTNTYSAPTILAGGVLATPILANSGNPSGIGSASSDPANFIFNGGTFNYIGASTGTDHGITLTNSGGTIDVISSTTLTLNGTLIGNGGLTLIDSGTLTLASGNSYSGNTTISNGILNLNNVTGAGSGTIVLAGGTLGLTVGSQPTYANNLTVTANSTLNSAGGNNNIVNGAWSGGSNVTLNINMSSGGTFSVNGSMTNFYGTVELGNNTGFFRFNAGGGNTQFGATNAVIDVGTSTATLEARNPGTMGIGALAGGPNTIVTGPSSTAGTLVWAIGSSTNVPDSTYYGTIKNSAANEIGSVTKIGIGTLTLAGQNTYSGSTTISSGTLALINNPFTGNDGSINNSATINLATGTLLDVSGRSDGTFQLGINQTLTGRGTIKGSLNAVGNVQPGGGVGGGTGTLTVTNAVTLNGSAWMKLNRASSPNSDRIVSSLSTVTYGGTLIVTNIGAALQVGDTFTLFSGAGLASSSFSSIVLPNYYTWNTSQLAVNGSVSVSAMLPPPAFSGVDFSTLNSGSITINAINGVPGSSFSLLTSTNLTLPLANWTVVVSANFDGSGNYSGSITADPAAPQQYYLIQAR